MTRLVLVRHGNTFAAHETAVWVGARTDLPLTAEGFAQASTAADFIKSRYEEFSAVISSPLQRTQQTASAIASLYNLSITLDDALREVDYGAWEGLSNADITARYGSEILRAYQDKDIWPEALGGAAAQTHYHGAIVDFLHKIQKNYADQTCCVVTSNGILRMIYALITNQPAGNTAKVKTGHISEIQHQNGAWQIKFWNCDPRQPLP